MSITPIFGWDNSRVASATEQELQGVGFWPRVAARLIDMSVHFLVTFFTGMLFLLMLVAASSGRIPPLIPAKLNHARVVRFIFALLSISAYHVILTSVHRSGEARVVDSCCTSGWFSVQAQKGSDP